MKVLSIVTSSGRRSRVSFILFCAILFSRTGGGYYLHELSSLPLPSRGLPLSICLVRVGNHGLSLVAAVVRSVEIVPQSRVKVER